MAVNTSRLEKEIAALTEQVKKQNQFQRRLILGIAAGVGTALGATVVAAMVLLLLRPLFIAVGLSNVLPERVDIEQN